MKNCLFIIVIAFLFFYCSKYDLKFNKNTTHMSKSTYNTMDVNDYHLKMKSEKLQYSDIAWQAKRTYGWNCSEVISLSSNIQTNGQELKYAHLMNNIKGYYNVATCESGLKLRVYPRYDSYPIITNINGGFD